MSTDNPVPSRKRGEMFLGGASIPANTTTWVTGTAPSSTPDLEEVIHRVEEQLTQVNWVQLQVTHAGDDDGIWFFWLSDASGEVQIESSHGVCPFLVETDKHDDRFTARTPQEAADTIIKWLRLPGGREVSPWHSK